MTRSSRSYPCSPDRPTRVAVQVADSITTVGLIGTPDPSCRAAFLAELYGLAEVCAGSLVAEIPAGLDADLDGVRRICAQRGCTFTVRVQD